MRSGDRPRSVAGPEERKRGEPMIRGRGAGLEFLACPDRLDPAARPELGRAVAGAASPDAAAALREVPGPGGFSGTA
jgi:hypothetical protein